MTYDKREPHLFFHYWWDALPWWQRLLLYPFYGLIHLGWQAAWENAIDLAVDRTSLQAWHYSQGTFKGDRGDQAANACDWLSRYLNDFRSYGEQ